MSFGIAALIFLAGLLCGCLMGIAGVVTALDGYRGTALKLVHLPWPGLPGRRSPHRDPNVRTRLHACGAHVLAARQLQSCRNVRFRVQAWRGTMAEIARGQLREGRDNRWAARLSERSAGRFRPDQRSRP